MCSFTHLIVSGGWFVYVTGFDEVKKTALSFMRQGFDGVVHEKINGEMVLVWRFCNKDMSLTKI